MMAGMGLPWPHLTLHLPRACGRVRCEVGWRLAPVWSQRLADMDLWFVWAGRGTMRLRGGTCVDLRPGVAMWMRPGGLYIGDQDPADRLGVTFIHFELIDQRTGQRPRPLPREVHEVVDVPYVDAVMRRVVDLLQGDSRENGGAGHEAARTLLRGLLMDFDADVARPTRAEPTGTAAHHRELVMRIAGGIRESPSDVPPVAELARQAGYSPDHFTRVFQQVLNQSPQAYIVQQRVSRAQQLLLESSLTVTQIADVLGYESVYFFSRQFKEKTGLSPSAYRRGLTE